MSKIIKPEVKIIEKMAGGPGYLKRTDLIESNADIFNSGRTFAHIVLEKDCGVGYHIHNGDGEIYYILKGEGEYNDNGTVVTVKAGDVTHTLPGEGHGITNVKDEPMEMIALILFEKQKEE